MKIIIFSTWNRPLRFTKVRFLLTHVKNDTVPHIVMGCTPPEKGEGGPQKHDIDRGSDFPRDYIMVQIFHDETAIPVWYPVTVMDSGLVHNRSVRTVQQWLLVCPRSWICSNSWKFPGNLGNTDYNHFGNFNFLEYGCDDGCRMWLSKCCCWWWW